MVELLREVMPYSVAVFVAARTGTASTPRCYGFELEDIFAFGLRSVRDEVAGDRLPDGGDAPGVFPFDPALAARGGAPARQITLLQAGVMGEPNGKPDSSPEIQELYFDIVARVARHRRRQRRSR